LVAGRRLGPASLPVLATAPRRRLIADREPRLGEIAHVEIVRRARTAHLRRNPARIDGITRDIRPQPCDRESQRGDVELALCIRSRRAPSPTRTIDTSQR